MGFRFSKSIKLLPGVRLNLSRGGISASIGRPGATINVGRRGVRATTGVPGSGLSYSTDLYRRHDDADQATPPPAPAADTDPLPPPGKTLGVGLLRRLFARIGRPA